MRQQRIVRRTSVCGQEDTPPDLRSPSCRVLPFWLLAGHRTENGGTTTTTLHELRTSAHVRRTVAGADILVVETGLNDLDETGPLDQVAAGTCGGSVGLSRS